MAEFDPTNRGAIFVNDRKEQPNQPDRTGSINVEGVEYFLDGWLKESKSGQKFMSLSIKRKDRPAHRDPIVYTPQTQRRPTAPGAAASYGSARPQQQAPECDDDLPF
jgi:hypothetical protein